jgi:hypothetical protein
MPYRLGAPAVQEEEGPRRHPPRDGMRARRQRWRRLAAAGRGGVRARVRLSHLLSYIAKNTKCGIIILTIYITN